MSIKSIFSATISCLLLFSSYVEAAPANIDKIVVVVNNDVITQRELDAKIDMFKLQLSRSGTKIPKNHIVRKQVLDSLIDVLLQQQIARNNGIQISDKELDSIIATIAKNNGLSVEELKKSVPEKEKMSFNSFRNQIREQILINRVQQNTIGRGITVSEKEVANILRHPPKLSNVPVQYHVIDVLFEITDDFTQDQKDIVHKVAKEMLAKLQQGVSVDQVVQDGQNKLKGRNVQSIDLGWRRTQDLPTLFAKEVVKMKPKQAIGPIVAPNGLHLLKLLEVHGSPFLQSGKISKEQAYDMVYHRKLMEKVKPWLEEQRAKAYIKIIK